MPPPSLARGDSAPPPSGHRTPPHGAGSSTPQRNKDPASRPRSQSAVSNNTITRHKEVSFTVLEELP